MSERRNILKRTPHGENILKMVIPLCFFLVLVPELVFSENITNNLKVLIIHTSFDNRHDNIGEVLDRTSLMRTRMLGFQGFYIDSAAIPRPRPPDTHRDLLRKSIPKVLSREGKTADLILFGLYRVEEDQISLEYECLDIEDFSLLASVRKEMEIDLYLDRSVSTVVREVFEHASENIARIARRRGPQQMETEEEVAVKERYVETHNMFPDEKIQKSPVNSYSSASIIFFLGRAAEYFTLGLDVQGGVLFPLLTGSKTIFSIGFSAGYMRLFPSEPDKAAYIRSLIPFGITSEYIIGSNQPLTWFISATAGGLYRIDTDDIASGYLSSLVPYLKIGGGLRLLPLGSRAELNINASGLVVMNFYQESSSEEISVDTISGISSGISLRIRI